MPQVLQGPEILRWYQHNGFGPELPVMCLRWHGEDLDDRTWALPDGVTIQGPPPARLGLRILRQKTDAYSVQLIWDRTALEWESLSRSDLLHSSLKTLLAMLGTDLWHLLDQPAHVSSYTTQTAA